MVTAAALVVVYVLGPMPSVPVYQSTLPAVPPSPDTLETYVAEKESRHHLKPDNQARIIWHDSSRQKTAFSIIYLHGFSASCKEGDPVHLDIASRFGCNLYLSRLQGHGIDTSDPLLHMTATGLWDDAREALSIGKSLGDKVIVMGTSTGGTLALKLAATFPNDVFAVINLSPNIAINDKLAFIANNPWGLQMARIAMRGKFRETPEDNPVKAQYWYNRYRLEGVVELENLLETTMDKNTFAAVRQPVLNLYYYKDEAHQDPTVRVSAILRMQEELGTPDSLKTAIPIPNAGAHVIGCYLTSRDVPGVEAAITRFMEQQLKMKPLSLTQNSSSRN